MVGDKGSGWAAVSAEAADAVRQALDEIFAEESSTNASKPTKSAGVKTDKVADEIAAALSELFSGKDTGAAGQTFDEEVYAKAKPLFDRLLNLIFEEEAEQRAEHESILRTIAEAHRVAQERKPTPAT